MREIRPETVRLMLLTYVLENDSLQTSVLRSGRRPLPRWGAGSTS